MDTRDVRKDIENINTSLNRFTEVVVSRMDTVEAQERVLIDSFVEEVYNRVDFLTLPITRMLYGLSQRVNHTIIRVTFHASPEIIALLATMVTIYNIVVWVIRIFSVIRIIGTIWQINQMVMTLWPQYRAWWNNMLTKVSELSGYLGWGADGVSHLLNAVTSGINVVGGLMGKSDKVIQFEMMDKAQYTASLFGNILKQLQDDPAKWISSFFEQANLSTAFKTRQWWGGISEWIGNAADDAKEATQGVQNIIGELSAIQNNMPEIVRANIPAKIWSGLQTADDYINRYIIPNIWTINNALTQLNNVFDAHSAKLSDLAGKLAHPGEILLTVDDLPQYAKDAQLNMIDDVTSRQFEILSEGERRDLEGDLAEFDRIDRLARAPTPEPVFFNIEIPVGKTVRGITAEPHETWFVGNF